MVRKHKLLGLLTTLLLLLASSCNFFFIPQHGRENSNDAQAQIYNLFAYQSGENEVTVQFAWRDPVYIDDNDEKIQEAVIVYNVGEALPVRSIPLPPDSGGTEGFDFKDGQYIYSKIIDGLAEGDDINFSLYPHTRREWLAPLFEKLTVRDPIDIPLIADPTQYPAEDAFRLFSDGKIEEIISGAPAPEGVYNLDPGQFLILRFELPDNIRCTQAFLDIPTNTESGTVAPLTFKYIEYVPGDNERLCLIDYGSGNTISSFGTMPIDVTDAINAAILYGSDALLIRIDSGTAGPFTHDTAALPPTEFLTITYQEF
ncbi:MAG: hypothetical protein SVR04_08265 [Spirochaetota bacterium]|nr:hypothetical protein [Spirochaetota bacterium]